MYDEIAQTLDDAKVLHGEKVGMHGPGSLVNLMDVYLKARKLKSESVYYQYGDGPAEGVHRAEQALFKALEAEKNEV